MKIKFLTIPLLAISLQSCVIPGSSVEPMQIAQYPHKNESFKDYKKAIIVFKGISCPKDEKDNIDEESSVKNFIKVIKSTFRCSEKSYLFRSADNDSYYIKQLKDSSGGSTRSSSYYEYYTVPAGKYYYPFEKGESKITDSDLKKAFYFEAEEGKATYVGDFIYDSENKKIIILDNYSYVKTQLDNKLPVPLEKALARGSKVKYQ